MIEIQAHTNAMALAPSAAIVLYAQKKGSSYGPSAACYATVHDVTVSEGIPQLGAGMAVSRDGLMTLFRGLDPQRTEVASLTPTRVLTQGSRWMVWYCAPSKRRVWFKTNDGIGERTAEVPLPGLVFAVSPTGWYVFALKSGRRPGASTRLLQVPFYNVWKRGKICTGSTRMPQGDARRDPAAWERAFFESAFTHSNIHDGPLVAYKGGAVAFWKALLRGKKFDTFPTEVLVDGGMTLGQFLAELNRSLQNE